MNNSIKKNTMMLYLLTAAKMVVPLITLPYLTRILSVSTYGTVSYVKAVMQYMQLLIDFGFLLSGTKDIALNVNNKHNLNKQISAIFFARVLLCLLAGIVLAALICFIPILRQNAIFTVLSFIVVALTVLLMDFYFRGIEKMEIITIRFLLMKGVATVLTFFVVKGDSDYLWIPILDIIGSVIAIIWVWYELIKGGVRIIPVEISDSISKLKESAVYFASDIATTAFNALNTVLIGIFIAPVEVAFWSICMQLIGAVQSLYTPITSGIYPQMIKTKNFVIIKKVLRVFMPVVVIGCIITFFIAEPILLLVGGEKYGQADFLLKLLIPVLLFSFPGMLFGWPTLGAIGKQKETTYTTIIAAVFQVVMLVVLIIIDRFTLVSIAILRCVTELVLMLARLRYVSHFRNDFNLINEE